MPRTKPKPKTSPDSPDSIRADGVLNLLSEPGAIQIEAAADGTEADRFRIVTPRARSLPPLMWGSALRTFGIMDWTSPESTSMMPTPVPL